MTGVLLSPESQEERRVEELEFRQIPALSRRSHYDGKINYNLETTTSAVGYFNWVEDYTARQLSFGSDILNAFAGVGNYLGDSFGSRMIFGLPEKYIPQALMWSCLGLAEQRVEVPQIPGWSWASSSTPIKYYWIMGHSTSKNYLVNIASLVYFHFQDPDRGLRKLDVEERWIEHKISLTEFENHDGVPEGTGKYFPGAWRSNKTWLECPHNP